MLLVALDGIAQEGLLITRISSSPVFKGDLIHFIQTNIRIYDKLLIMMIMTSNMLCKVQDL